MRRSARASTLSEHTRFELRMRRINLTNTSRVHMHRESCSWNTFRDMFVFFFLFFARFIQIISPFQEDHRICDDSESNS